MSRPQTYLIAAGAPRACRRCARRGTRCATCRPVLKSLRSATCATACQKSCWLRRGLARHGGRIGTPMNGRTWTCGQKSKACTTKRGTKHQSRSSSKQRTHTRRIIKLFTSATRRASAALCRGASFGRNCPVRGSPCQASSCTPASTAARSGARSRRAQSLAGCRLLWSASWL